MVALSALTTISGSDHERGLAEQTAVVAGGTDLAKELANLVGNLISVPVQNSLDFGIGPNDAMRFTLKIQPVLPFTLTEDWNLITRTILPVIDAASSAPNVPSAFGLGDTVQSFFLSPKRAGRRLDSGAGPALLYPTATDDLLGTGKWARRPHRRGAPASRIWADVVANLLAAQLFTIGKQPMQVAFGGRYYVDAPSGGPEWWLRLSLV